MNHSELVNHVAEIVCKKPYGTSIDDCITSRTNKSMSCGANGKCRIAEKTYEQLSYVVQSLEQNTFLRACPGSGKTEVIGLKAAYEIAQWPYSQTGIAILTFTNNAADVINNRINEFVGLEGSYYPHYIGTLDSWIHRYIANPFGHIITRYQGKAGDYSIRVVDGHVSSKWLERFKCKTHYYYYNKTNKLKSKPIFANQLFYDHELGDYQIRYSTNDYISARKYYVENGAFSAFRTDKDWLTPEYFEQDLQNTQGRFWNAGFLTHDDVRDVCYRLLTKSDSIGRNLAARFPVIIIDECQDLSWTELEILGVIEKHSSKLHFVGDLNQAIYDFKNGDPQKITDFVNQHGFVTNELTQNFRSVQPIVDVCGRIIAQNNVQGRQLSSDAPTCVYFTYQKSKPLSELPIRFLQYLKQFEVAGDSIAILARNNTLVNELKSTKTPPGRASLPARAIYLWQSTSIEAKKDAIADMGRFVAGMYFDNNTYDANNQFCPESITSALTWRLFLGEVLCQCIEDDKLSNLSLTWKLWATALRKKFPKIATSTAKSFNIYFGQNIKQYKAPSNQGSKKVIDTLVKSDHSPPTSLRVTTFHKIKGETLDAVLVVSSRDKKSKGGHWTHWIDLDPNHKEYTRFAYVASSRPRSFLAWAVPESSEVHQNMKKLGFVAANESGTPYSNSGKNDSEEQLRLF